MLEFIKNFSPEDIFIFIDKLSLENFYSLILLVICGCIFIFVDFERIFSYLLHVLILKIKKMFNGEARD